jgi:hypothetical protein
LRFYTARVIRDLVEPAASPAKSVVPPKAEVDLEKEKAET